jgi:poly(beta-D-mannuronate) lyase
MKKPLLLNLFVFFSLFGFADTIIVKDIAELNKANATAKPGDIIILQNGVWNNVIIKLNCNGTKEQPIVFKAQAAGKVLISGNSQLKLGGNYITVDAFYFVDGYAGDDAVVDFRIDKKQLANNCRLTNCVINDFNNPKRMDENYWISLSGKHNRIDHCSFLNKKNMGVLMAVILDDERSRENFHSVDHNYFGVRLPLASNSGEIIRVGVSQHCEFNSNTQITDNFFEHCDGETEIVSIKSCSNIIRNNLFKECQGGVVLRHGNYNTVENNIFLGNGKDGTGGVRIINKGQWVVNNLFYQCRGVGFRSPLSVMNGVPNSPAFRYVPVTDAVVANNSFYNCTPISLCEGSDTERSVPPSRVYFENNIFYNDKDNKIYNAYDNIGGFNFNGNAVNTKQPQQLTAGFIKTGITKSSIDNAIIPGAAIKNTISDSLQSISATRISGKLSNSPGFADAKKFLSVKKNAYTSCGAAWFDAKATVGNTAVKINCKNADDIAAQLSKAGTSPVVLVLTGEQYNFTTSLIVTGNVSITSNKKAIAFNSTAALSYLFQIKGGNTLSLTNINVDLSGSDAKNFISSDINGSSGHSNFSALDCSFKNFGGTFFNSAKYTMFDSIVVNNCSFNNIKGTVFDFNNETDKKGYYTVEKLKITNTSFTNNSGQLLGMLRGGNDESTMGPLLIFKKNTINNCVADVPLIKLNGTQRSFIENNTFTSSNINKAVLQYEDAVRAVHILSNNIFKQSGIFITDKFVESYTNTIKTIQ